MTTINLNYKLNLKLVVKNFFLIMSEINKSLFIETGANGSGKTTLVNELLSNINIII